MSVPQCLNVELSDIAVILGNLLDNALDAVARVEDRRILLDVEYSRSVLYVKAKNTFDGAVEYAPAEPAEKRAASCAAAGSADAGSAADAESAALPGRLLASRKAGREHGFGLGNVRRAVGKYRGRMEIACEGNEFTVALMLLLG